MRLRRLKANVYRPEIIGVDEAKTILYRRLRLDLGKPGSCHFPTGRDAEYYAQMTSEKKVTRYRKGQQVVEWIQERSRNEALDCRVLAHAALRLYLHTTRQTIEEIGQRRMTQQVVAQPRPTKPKRQSWIRR